MSEITAVLHFMIAFLFAMVYNVQGIQSITVQFYTSRCSAVGSAPALGAGCREFESRHLDQISRNGFMPFLLISFDGETRTIKCNSPVDCCRRRLDGGEHLSAPFGADANESRHLDQRCRFLRKPTPLYIIAPFVKAMVKGVVLWTDKNWSNRHWTRSLNR